MAEPIAETVGETVEETIVNNATAGTKTPSTPEGMAIAYGSLVIMALFPIIIGAFRSVRHHKEQKVYHIDKICLFVKTAVITVHFHLLLPCPNKIA